MWLMLYERTREARNRCSRGFRVSYGFLSCDRGYRKQTNASVGAVPRAQPHSPRLPSNKRFPGRHAEGCTCPAIPFLIRRTPLNSRLSYAVMSRPYGTGESFSVAFACLLSAAARIPWSTLGTRYVCFANQTHATPL